MRLSNPLVPLALLCLGAAGCMSAPHYPTGYAGAQNTVVRPDPSVMMAKQQLMQDLMNNPDLQAWHEQREKMALALGDRVFDKGFDRVFDSMITALATLGCRVTNMERTSHYITASIPQLPPQEEEALRHEGLVQYVQAKGYPPSVLGKQGPYDIDPTLGQSMMNRMGASGLTLSMVQQGPDQTKVKLRFDNVYYPHKVEELYKTV